MGYNLYAMTKASIPALPKLELPTEDGIPMENAWHRMQMDLLIESLLYHWRERSDFFVGGNMFIYYSYEQAQSVIEGRPLYRGPDFFVVKGVDGTKPRDCWIVWEEGGRFPDVIIEFLSPTTAEQDRHVKKSLYEQVFGTEEYFWYDPLTQELMGFELVDGQYQPKRANPNGWLWSKVLEAWLGVWEGEYQRRRMAWLRLYDRDGNLVPTPAEAAQQQAEAERQRAETERQRAEIERQRAERAEAELQRLKALLQAQGIEQEPNA
jgi:Uma2 family endonuclease